MPGLLQRAVGGALEGVGDALKENGLTIRKRKIAKMRAEREQALQTNQIGAADRRGLLNRKTQLKITGVREEGANKRNAATNATAKAIAEAKASKPKDTSAAEKRTFDSLVEIHTTADENGVETVDWNAVGKGLKAKGFNMLSRQALSRGKGVDELANRKRAEEQADAEVEEKTGLFFDDFDDPRDKGSPARFRERRISEIIAEGKGGKSAGEPGTRNARRSGSDNVIEITGTPESQKEQLAKVPVGTKVRRNGKIYLKKAGGFELVR